MWAANYYRGSPILGLYAYSYFVIYTYFPKVRILKPSVLIKDMPDIETISMWPLFRWHLTNDHLYVR